MRGPTPSLIAVSRPHHGLGNRVRVVFGAMALSRLTGRRLYSCWPVGRHFGSPLSELWQVSVATVPTWLPPLLSVRYPYRDESLDWLEAARGERVWQIRTPHALALPAEAEPWQHVFRMTPPVAAVASRVSAFHAAHLAGRPYVGVMVRAHPVSHPQTLTASPLTWYVDRLTALRHEHPGLRFFVSADTPEAGRALADAVPGCIALEDKGAYNSALGLTSAVTDLYLLAASCHLVGPHFSSFPELAQHLAGGDRLTLETSRSGPASGLDPSRATVAPDPVRPYDRVPLSG